jgi:site-specific DNA recombinase
MSGDVVLAYDLDRLSRGGQIDTAVIIDRIESAGADIAFVTLDFEKSETGALLRNVRPSLPHSSAKRLSNARAGGSERECPPASRLPHHGHTRGMPIRAAMSSTQKRHPSSVRCFDWALAEHRCAASSAASKPKVSPAPPANARWAYPVVRDVLRRPVYTGDAAAYAVRSIRRPGGGYMRRCGTSEEVVRLPGIAPAIISHEEQEAVLARFARNKAQASRNNRDPEAALLRAGFCFCGHCGRACTVVPASRPGSSPHYRCGSRVEGRSTCPVPTAVASTLDAPVWERVAASAVRPGDHRPRGRTARTAGGLDRDLDALDKQLTVTIEKQARTARAIAAVDDDDAAAPLLVELKALATRRKALGGQSETRSSSASRTKTPRRQKCRRWPTGAHAWGPISTP